MSDLTEFLLARIAEDEAVAREDSARAWGAYREKMLAMRNATNLAGTGLVPSWRDWHAGWDADIARHDPDRVLAECEAKRRIVEAYPAEKVWVSEQSMTDVEPVMRDGGWAHPIVLYLLAQPYADHPDFRPEWRV